VKTLVDGTQGSPEYRLRFKDASGKDISPWHDIPLHTGEKDVFNALIEIPKNTKPKMEVATKEPQNPIAQDVKKGKLRDYHGPIFWNYGMLPQTWEDPGVEHPVTKCSGDNDPLDVVEIGSESLAQGAVEPVKVLGVLAMIDDGELDWKVIAIRTADPLAKELGDIADVETKCPGVISGIREWFRWYKTPDGKPLNAFGFEEKALDKAFTLEVIEETHEAWKKLRDGSTSAGKLWVK
jgi:inorganic pyrophosphatase